MSACDFVLHLYNELRGHRYGGFFTFSNPRFMLRDPELIKAVCIRDFDHFTDRNTLLNADMEPIAGRVLASLTGEEWRYLRSIVSQAFSPSKIKDLCRSMNERSQRFFAFLEKQHGQSAKSGLNIENVDGLLQVEMTDLASRYCTDILAATALGVDSDSFRNPHNELYKMGQLIGNFEGNGALMLLGHLFNPKLMKFLGLPIVRTRALDFFRALTQDLMSSRRKENIIRQDVLQLLIQARNSDEENAKGRWIGHAGPTAWPPRSPDLTPPRFFPVGIRRRSCVRFSFTADLAELRTRIRAAVAEVTPDLQARVWQDIDFRLEEMSDDDEEGRRGNPVPARSLLLSNSTKGAARLNVPIRRTNHYQQ
ncbi:hypothetical protein ANN_20565 [Periplaneta americana]|uniref:Cytochrome P450 n=1 Tax=Periplaneta americana TaxID=6978 RepID=A0ABQ8SDR3_PERAM|nr:hypothetical protein ANN_20565 [Periplaneta americana]